MAHGNRDLGDLIIQPTSIGGDFDECSMPRLWTPCAILVTGTNKKTN